MANTIYWYDFETTGIDPARDRAIQFAGVRTDLELNVIDEPLNLFCYPGDDVIPSPEAMLVTGLRMTELQSKGLRETTFIEQILAEFSQPGTCVCGFNSIRFDDEFTRNILYRNFLDPYAREWQAGNSRWDVIDMFRMAHALRPDGFTWPQNEEGVPSFRLEALTRANGVSHEAAHDAVSDVLATIDVTRRLKEAQPRLYQYLYKLRQKKEVISQLYPLGKFAVLHVSSMYPAKNNCIAVVVPLCAHPTNANGVICYDLAFDPAELIEIGPDELHRRIFTAERDLEAGEERVHLKTIHVNRCPAVAPLSTLTEGQAERLGLDLGAAEANLERLKSASGIVEKIQDAFGKASFPETDDPDLMLYQGGFFSDRDRTQMLALRGMDPDALSKVGDTFDDERVVDLVFRYRARNYPESLSAEERASWNAYRREKWGDGAEVEAALARIDELIAEGSDREVLADLKAYVTGLWESLAADR